MELRNGTKLEFVDISNELYREYIFANGTVSIAAPTHLSVSENGHRVLDANGLSHYIPMGWIHLEWKAADDKPHFVK